MKNRKIWAAVLALCLVLAGCTAGTGGESAGEQEGQSSSAAESQTGSEAVAPGEPETPALPELPEGPVTAADAEELSGYLELAMQRAEQPPAVEAAFLDSEADPEMTVRNLYYALLSEHPECKYAYDLAMERTGDGLYRITFSYMPYRTGDYPAGCAGEEAGHHCYAPERPDSSCGAGPSGRDRGAGTADCGGVRHRLHDPPGTGGSPLYPAPRPGGL